ncbi:MAG: proline--tRNA ligase, partial [Lachnospiraceae bacterium]|nr:proline--tRNA ligase [Lachnospiraceae bacterium]
CVLVRRDTREKMECSLEEAAATAKELLKTIQQDMFDKAKKHQQSHVTEAKSYGAFKDAVENKPGFIRAMWCGDVECENKIKEDTTATSRCMPLKEEEPISDVCVCCGKPAHKLVYWGKAY